jgi:2-polyprenyl-3-methyl-5-hydroxy-6-metoxy-1,4-benzoquinol methylase
MDPLKDKVVQSASFYEKSFLNFDYQLADLNFRTLKPFFKGKKALELGPASGYMTKLLVKEFDAIHLVEGSESLLQQIPHYPNTQKFCSYFEEYETTEQYDTIVMSHVLEHIKDPVLVLRKIYSWLHDDGVFLISVPNAKSIHRIVAVEMGLLKSVHELNSRDHELGHYRVYDMDMLKSHVTEAGFKIRETGGIFLKPVSNGQIEQHWTAEMIEGFYKAGKYFHENCAEIFIACVKQ